MKLYLAGPLFTTAERDFNAELAKLLRSMCYDVFLPQESEQRDATARNIFDGDVKGIDWCGIVVANMDGSNPDSGTCWECGSVYRRKPVVLYRTDIRREADFGPYNLMMHQAAQAVLDYRWKTVQEIAMMIDETLRKL
jgi:nucleoside 2-deoxyribosyltransferase